MVTGRWNITSIFSSSSARRLGLVNDILRYYLFIKNLVLVDLELEFSWQKGEILLADEIDFLIPDVFGISFRRDLGGLIPTDEYFGRNRKEGNPLFEARIYITLKKGILDPEGKTVKQGLKSLGYDQVEDVKTGKYLILTLKTADRIAAEQEVREMCEKLLVNLVIERYTFELREVEE